MGVRIGKGWSAERRGGAGGEGTCAHYMHFNLDFEKRTFVLRL